MKRRVAKGASYVKPPTGIRSMVKIKKQTNSCALCFVLVHFFLPGVNLNRLSNVEICFYEIKLDGIGLTNGVGIDDLMSGKDLKNLTENLLQKNDNKN